MVAGVGFAATSMAQEPGACLASAAQQQIGVTVLYDPAYRRIAYPNGDVPSERGVCTDVLVRAYRLLGLDLQAAVHEDMKASWTAYPKLWGLARPDPNIDHRRVPNLAAFLERHGKVLPITQNREDYAAGDIVAWRLPSGVPHIGMISTRRSPAGVPLVIHNIGSGTVEEDVLFGFTITGHYRHLPESLRAACAPSDSSASSTLE